MGICSCCRSGLEQESRYKHITKCVRELCAATCSLYCTASCLSHPLNQGSCLLLTLSPMEEPSEIDARLVGLTKHKLGTLGLLVAIAPVGRSDPCQCSTQPRARKPLAWSVHLARRAVRTVVQVGPHGIRYNTARSWPCHRDSIDKAIHGVCR